MPEINTVKAKEDQKGRWTGKIITLLVIVAAIVLGIVYSSQLKEAMEAFVDWVSFITFLRNIF